MQAMEIELHGEEAEDLNMMDIFTVKEIKYREGRKVVTLQWSRR